MRSRWGRSDGKPGLEIKNRSKRKAIKNVLVYCVKSPFISIVIPGLTRNPVFLNWIPAGVYPVLDKGLE
jgi:hypothetical protein